MLSSDVRHTGTKNVWGGRGIQHAQMYDAMGAYLTSCEGIDAAALIEMIFLSRVRCLLTVSDLAKQRSR